MTALYNEIDPHAAAWLEELERHGHIAQGTVDRRSIADLTPADVAGPGQRHFFAGIGGWSHAFRLAGVVDDADVWSGSCPCQPFSDAGQGRGVLDPRHLWPAWFALIRECRPPIIFGEQVASRDGLVWLDAVFADLERCGYAVGAADLCAAGVGAPHQRQRLYFVAYAGEQRRLQLRQRGPRDPDSQTSGRREDRGMANAGGTGPQDGRDGQPTIDRGADGSVADANGESGRRRRKRASHGRPSVEPAGHGDDGELGDSGGTRGRRDSGGTRGRRDSGVVHGAQGEVRGEGSGPGREHGRLVDVPGDAGATRGFWNPADWILCRDPAGGAPVARPVEPGTWPLAHGVPGRVGLLRGYGNAIVPQVAAQFIRSALEAIR